MTLTFYPHTEDVQRGTLEERIDILMEAAERYKTLLLERSDGEDSRKLQIPREQTIAYNWEEIARVLREVRELSETGKSDKLKKSLLLTKLADVYEVLRAAKMAKLEAVRLALLGEADQLKSGL